MTAVCELPAEYNVCAPQPPALAAFDLFAGIGGFRAAASGMQGKAIEFVGSCEIDAHSVRTYQAMFAAPDEFHLSDVRTLTRPPARNVSNRTVASDRVRLIQDSLPSFSLLTAGFPCQPHSLMGNRLGTEDDRGSLFEDIAAIIHAMEPDHFVLENVRAIKSVNDGALYRSIVRTLEEELGYNLRVWELNAAEYGIPQTRRRLFFVGSRGHLPEDPPPKMQLANCHYPTVWHLLEETVPEKYYLSDRILRTILTSQHKGYRRPATINCLIARPLTRTMHKMHRASQDNYYSDAFIHGYYDTASNRVTLAPTGSERIRRITPREAFRIQSFSEELVEAAVASGTSDTQLYMQAGNAVPVRLARAVLQHCFGGDPD